MMTVSHTWNCVSCEKLVTVQTVKCGECVTLDHPKYRAEVDRIANLLMDAWTKAEPEHSVTKYPTSYIATFVDLATAVVKDRGIEP